MGRPRKIPGLKSKPVAKQQIIKLGEIKFPVPKYCPVTGNQPMKCTKAGFSTACAKFQEMEKNRYAPVGIRARSTSLTRYCAICLGDYIPDNVTFIDIPEFKQPIGENEMSKRYVASVCESCGKTKNVCTHHGKMVCSSCVNFRTTAKNNPEMVIAALQEFGNLPEGGGSPQIDGIMVTLREILRGEQHEDIVALAKRRMDVMKTLEYSYNDALDARKDAELELEEQSKEIGELNIVIDTLKQSIRAYQDEENARLPQQPIPPAINAATKSIINDLAWRLADGMLVGNITGIGVEDLRTIRGLAE